MSTTLLRRARKIYTCDDHDRMIENGWVYIRDGRIVDLGEEPCPISEAHEEIAVDGCILTPGLINLHHHFFQSLARAMPIAEKGSILEWLLELYPIWAELDADGLYWATKVAGAELLLSGGTTSVDHSYMVPGAISRSSRRRLPPRARSACGSISSSARRRHSRGTSRNCSRQSWATVWKSSSIPRKRSVH